VFTYSIGNFPTIRCLEQIRNDVCHHDCDVKIVCVGGGMSYGAVGMSHHATEDLAIMRALANMLVVAPGDLWEAGCATDALLSYRGPAYLRLDKSAAEPVTREGERFELGKARMLRDGRDVTLVTAGGILGEAMKAASILARAGVHCRVLSMHTIKPLDTGALVKAAEDTGCIVTVEEHSVEGGLGGAVAEALLESGQMPASFLRIGLRNTFSSVVGSQSFLRRTYALDASSIAESVRALSARGKALRRIA
jgi:transketolase